MTNSDLSAIIAQGSKGNFTKTEQKFSKEVLLQKYYVPRVDKQKGQTQNITKFRIIPNPEGGSPFQEVHFHYMKVNGKWVKLLCLSETGEDCPICDAHEGLMSMGNKEDARQYRKSLFYIVRGIERGKEHEGVKFWRFKKNFKGTGEFDKILAKINLGFNILDPHEGYDLHVSCGLDERKNSVIQDISCVKPSPLAESEDEIQALINDDTTWKDVFRPKTKEYMEDVVEGRAQYWDNDLKKYVRPGEAEEIQNNLTNDDINFESSLADSIPDEKPTEKAKVAKTETKKATPKAEAKKVEEKPVDLDQTILDSDDDDDLPF